MTTISVTLYYTRVIQPYALSAFEKLLCPERFQYLSQIRHPKAQICSLTGDLLLNQIIHCRFGNVHLPLNRKTTSNGKPYLPDFPDFHFSISHSGDLVICAVSTVPVGVDLELPHNVRPGIAARWFSPEEQALISKTPYAFFELWMAKEAVLKEIGCGLSGGLRTVSVSLFPTPHLTAPIDGCWHSIARALLPGNISVMTAVVGRNPPSITVHPLTVIL